MSIIREKALFHLSTVIMERSDREDDYQHMEEEFDERIQDYADRIFCSGRRSQAIQLRTNALKFIDQWRRERLEQLDQHIRFAGQRILNAFDQYQGLQQQYKCSHRVKCPEPPPSRIASTMVQPARSSSKRQVSTNDDTEDVTLLSNSSSGRMDALNNHSHIGQPSRHISIDRLRSTPLSSPSPHDSRQDLFDLADYGRDFTYETLAYLPRSSSPVAMTICANSTLVYAQDYRELVIVSLNDPRQATKVSLEQAADVQDLCYVEWLSRCLVITKEQLYLLDYQTTDCALMESGVGYITGAVDNLHSVFYLLKQSTLYKYDRTSFAKLQADEYPIADGYLSRKMTLDNKTNDYLALLVNTEKEQKNYVLVYSTRSLADGYLYKIVINDRIDRQWICSTGDEGWLIRGTHPGSCFDLNVNGLRSVRTFDSFEIRNLIPMNEHQRFLLCTHTEIFVLMKYPFVQTF